MKQPKLLVIVLLLAVLIILSVASVAWSNPFSWNVLNNIFHKQFTWQTVTDNNFGVSIKVPTSWVKLQYPNGMQNTSVGFKKPPDYKSGNRVISSIQKLEIIKQDLPKVNFESWLKIWITTQKNVVSSNDTTIDGKTAYKVIRNNDSTENPKAITIFVNGGDKTYQLDWSMGEDYFNNKQSEINQILGSVHFTE
jgi:hypothetical protein